MARFPVPAPQFNGQHRRVELGNAFEWLKQGWALFVAWPGQWLALTVVLLVLQMGISIVPLVGSLAASLLAPIFAAGVLYACRKVANGKMPEIADLFHGFSHRASELVLLGNVALRCRKRLLWDAPAMKATNAPEAERYLTGSYRAGWDLPR